MRLLFDEVDGICWIEVRLIESESIGVLNVVHHFRDEVCADDTQDRLMGHKVYSMSPCFVFVVEIPAKYSTFIEFLCQLIVLEYCIFCEFCVVDTTSFLKDLSSLSLV